MRRLMTATMVAAGIAMVQPAWAQADLDQQTKLKFDTAIMVPGAVLQPGTYVFREADPVTSDIVEIWNEDQTRLITQTLTIPAKRMDPKGDTVLTLARTKAGSPPALHRWFYPGRLIGHEFVYSEKEAREISDDTKKIVLAHDAPEGSNLESLGRARLWRIGPGGERAEYRREDTAQRGTQTAAQQDRKMTERPAEKPAQTAKAGQMMHQGMHQNLERHVAQMEELLNRMLEPRTGAVGTTGATGEGRVTVDRAQLEQLKNHLQQLKRELDQRR